MSYSSSKVYYVKILYVQDNMYRRYVQTLHTDTMYWTLCSRYVQTLCTGHYVQTLCANTMYRHYIHDTLYIDRRQKLVPVPFHKDQYETLYRLFCFSFFFHKTLYCFHRTLSSLNCVNIKEFESTSLIKLKCDIDAVSIKN